ncbi:MAG: metallophosphoesterase family protein [Janthinobacterium lividum]
MKIAVISDIHGNLFALRAVLDAIAARGVDRIVNLGDLASGPLQPAETIDLLMPLGVTTIKGNHERQLLEDAPARMRLSDAYAHGCLRPDQLAWLETLPATLMIENAVLLVHGTPASDVTYFLETVTQDGCRPATTDEVAVLAGTTRASLILCGHTHLQRSLALDDGRLIVNPGSVGLQAYDDTHPFPHRMEAGSPHARYAIVTYGEDGWHVDFHRVGYDWDAAAAVAVAHGRPEWATPLRTGYVD